jgi:curved DNA-binding protein CbpA
MNGQLSEHPLAELIREISAARLSGALRLERQRAKLVIYFDQGDLHFAASNLRAHRLTEVLMRTRIVSETQLAEIRAADSERELEATLLRRGTITSETLDRARASQVADILRTALLWTSGSWAFDPRARVAEDIHVTLDFDQLLMECARHLPDDYIASRLNGTNSILSRPTSETNGVDLLLVEAFVLSRVQEPTTLAELTALSGVPEPDALRAIYGLSLSGLLDRNDWPAALSGYAARRSTSHGRSQRKTGTASAASPGANSETSAFSDEARELQEFFDRLSRARNHYEVLDLSRGVSGVQVKNAYHSLARRFHPDRFHQSDPQLRARVDSAFARIAQAYETLSDPSLRAAYEAKLKAKPATADGRESSSSTSSVSNEQPASVGTKTARAEAAFQRALAATKQNQGDTATSCFAEAANLAPRVARYRAYYGQALSEQRQSRRVAEAEFQAAIALEPDNASYRIMLAELYRSLGLRRRALGELERALMAEPKNKEVRAMLASLQDEL